MKTTENISLAGYAFTIETDAYEELGAYLDEIRSCFSADPSAEEITADIEERIAELLREKCVSGMVVDLTMIRDIKKRIGNPKQFAQEETEQPLNTDQQETAESQQDKKAEKKSWKNKRMWRNIDERILGGVCSGLGTYFGLDKVIFRIFFLIFFLIGFLGIDDGPFFGFSVLAYICLWIAMPAARTAEQKREMKGKPMNLRNYKEKDFNFEKEVKEVGESPAGQTAKRAGGIFIGIILLIMGLGGLLGCIVIPAIPEIIENAMGSNIYWGGDDIGEMMISGIICNINFWGLVIVMLGIMCVGMIYGGIMLLFDLRSPSWRPGLVIFIAWIISIFVIAGWVVKTIADALPTII